MAEDAGIQITISGHEYTVNAAVNTEILGIAVADLNRRITEHQKLINGDELRATVLTALEFAFEHTEHEKELEKMRGVVEKTKSRVRELNLMLAQEE